MAKKIMLDAGHYSYFNQSDVFKKYYEGNMSWKLQGYLKKELEEYGFEVATTRSNRDRDLELYSRGYKAKGYDLFLSLHSNWCKTEKTDRVVVIKSVKNKDNTLAKALALAIEEAMQTKEAYQIYTKIRSNGEDWYGVIRGAVGAGVKNCYILEHSFHSNLAAAKWLYEDDNLKELAKIEAKTIANYYGVSKPVTTTKYLRVLSDTLNTHTTPDFLASSVCGELEKGTVLTIVKEIERVGTNMYLTKAGYYVTASSKYVEVFER